MKIIAMAVSKVVITLPVSHGIHVSNDTSLLKSMNMNLESQRISKLLDSIVSSHIYGRFLFDLVSGINAGYSLFS